MKLSKFTKSTLLGLSIIFATSAISLSSCGFTWGDHDDDDEVVSPPKRTYDYILPYLKFGSYRSQVDNFMKNTKFFYKREADNYVFYTEGINENRIIYGYEFNPTFNRAYIILNSTKYTKSEAKNFLTDSGFIFAYEDEEYAAYILRPNVACYITRKYVDDFGYPLCMIFCEFNSPNSTPANDAEMLQTMRQQLLDSNAVESIMQHSQQQSQK